MAKFLYRLGAWSTRNRLKVVMGWVAVLVVAAIITLTGAGFASGDFEIPGTESSAALETVNREFPTNEPADRQSVKLVFQAPEGAAITQGAYADQVQSVIAAVSGMDHIAAVSDPFSSQQPSVSADGRVAVVTVGIDGTKDDAGTADTVTEALNDAIAPARAAGLTVETSGELGPIEISIFGPTEVIGVVVAFVVLFLTFGSLVAAGLNMLTAIVGVGVGALGVMAYSAISPIQSTTPTLAVMLGLAVGIDYALFILARFRSELREGRSVPDAVAVSTGTAGSAVVFAGSTVVIALAGLAVVDIPFLTEMGLAAAFAVLIAVAIALTLLPALLGTVGDRVLPKRERQSHAHLAADPAELAAVSRFEHLGAFIVDHAKAALVVCLVVLGIVATPVLGLDTALNVPGGSDPDSSERHAYTIISDSFGEGSQSPLVVLVEGDDAATRGAAVASTIGELPNVAAVYPPQPNAANTAAIISVIPVEGPNADSTADLVQQIRDRNGSIDGASVAVTGQTAIDIDVNSLLNSALVTYLVVIVGLSLVLLLILFRSILVPVMATLGFLLSLGAGMGVTIAVFQWGWVGELFGVKEGAPLLSLLPIIIVGILFGLAMDYQVFLVSRMHEAHTQGKSTRDAILHGFGRSAIVVAAAATIMAAVFIGFAFSGDTLMASIALALTVGVLADAFLVRMVMVPALLTLLGDRAWWIPRWLDRLLPTIDAEGHSLDEGLANALEPADHPRGAMQPSTDRFPA